MGVRTNKNICLYCFGDLDDNRVCKQCHKQADDTPVPATHLPQRTVLGDTRKYLFGKALGQGGFGITYLGWDLTRGAKVAIKEYFPQNYVSRLQNSNQVIIKSKQYQEISNRGLRRFIDEARILAQIKNLRGIVNVLDFFSANGTAYIVMEFLDGISLKKYVSRKGGSISVESTVAITAPIFESLEQIHKLGLVHRDISPDNIIITKQNDVKLIDFGAAKHVNLEGQPMSVILKQGFAPPEQYSSTGVQGPWTDIYALGVTIYYCITGKVPPESVERRRHDTLIPPSKLGIKIQPVVEFTLLKAMSVEVNDRYQDLSQMIKTLYPQNVPLAPTRALPINDVINGFGDDVAVDKTGFKTTSFIDVTRDVNATSPKSRPSIADTPAHITADALKSMNELNRAAQFRNNLLHANSPTINIAPTEGSAPNTAQPASQNIAKTQIIPPIEKSGTVSQINKDKQ